MKKWVKIVISFVLVFAILFAGTGTFETFKPKPQNSGFYYNGLYLYYNLNWNTGTDNGIVNGSGFLILKVIGNIININVTIPDFYPSHAILYRNVNLNVNGQNISYYGKAVILPFFYTGGKIVSYYNGDFINITGKSSTNLADISLNGIIQNQPDYTLDTEQYSHNSYYHYSNGSYYPAGYVYGTNTNVLFVLSSILGYEPVINFLLNLTYPQMQNGSVFYDPVAFTIYLHKTNLNLGPVDYFAVIFTYIIYVIFIAAPIIIFIGIPLIIIGIYRGIKKRKS